MKSFSAILYVAAAVRLTGMAEQVPSGLANTALVTLLPAGAVISYVKHSPETCGKRPSTAGIAETPFSSTVLSSAPLTSSVTTTFPNGSTVRTWPRVIAYLPVASGTGYTLLGPLPRQKSLGFGSVAPTGQVRSARRPPEFVMAN